VGAPAFTQLNGVTYMVWQPTASENWLLPAGGNYVTPISVTASPFSYTAQQTSLILIGGGQISSVAILGTYPPSAPAGFCSPPSGQFLLSYQQESQSQHLIINSLKLSSYLSE
jgi:hypothetical protein